MVIWHKSASAPAQPAVLATQATTFRLCLQLEIGGRLCSKTPTHGSSPRKQGYVGERIRRGIAITPIAVTATTLATITVSIGCAVMPAHCDTAEDLVLTADRALYAAKESGRNRVVSAQALHGAEAVSESPLHASP